LNRRSPHQQTIKKLLSFIEKRNQYLVSAHLNADGDAIASVSAMGMFLEKMGKKYYMLLHDKEIDARFKYLKNFDNILSYENSMRYPIESAVILDVPGVHRLGKVAKMLPERSGIIKIDHHPEEDDFAIINFTDEKASSATQLVYELIEATDVKVDLPLAEAIYTGIVYDTGRFSFSNTTARDHIICGKMVQIGVDPAEITSKIFFEHSFESVKTIGRGLSSMESYLDGRVNVIYLGLAAMTQNHQGEIEELANYSIGIRRGKVGVFIREIKPRLHKISFRSKDEVDVNHIAKSFGGGGHIRAAGCRIEGTRKSVVNKIIAEISKQLPQ
jgi:phosphoesterase RecJ-like protein